MSIPGDFMLNQLTKFCEFSGASGHTQSIPANLMLIFDELTKSGEFSGASGVCVCQYQQI